MSSHHPTRENSVEVSELSFQYEVEEPIEKQRHFGILQYAVNTRFRKMMLIGLINVILIAIFFFLVIFFFEMNKDNKDVAVTSTTMRTTTTAQKGGWCRNPYTLFRGKCLSYTATTDHLHAERISTSYGGYLVTMHNDQEIGSVDLFIKNQTSSNGNVWIGMYCTGNNVTNCVWDDTTIVDNDNFGNGHPNITIGLCVSYSVQDGKWYSIDYLKALAAVHEMPVIYGESYGCENTLGEYCYFVVMIPMNYVNAKLYCEQSCAQFASIHSIEENQWIRTLFSLYNNQNYTLGGYATSKDLYY